MELLTAALRAAAEEAPERLLVTDWTEDAWRRGRRRRALRRASATLGVAGLVAVLVALVALTPGLPRAAVPAGERRLGVTEYPQRLGHQWWLHDLPEDGAVAGIAQVRAGDGYAWQPFDESGTRYTFPDGAAPDVWPALSDDGTRVGYLTAGDRGLYRVLDLVAGSELDFPDLGSSWVAAGSGPGTQDSFLSGRTYGVDGQSPAFFSPVGGWLAVPGQLRRGWSGVLVLGPDGSVRRAEGISQPVGWLDDDRLLGRVFVDGEDPFQVSGIQLVVWDRRSGRSTPFGRAVLHAPAPGWRLTVPGQWWGTVRSDGTLWVSGTDQREAADGSIEEAPWVEGFAVPSLRPVGIDGRPADGPAPVHLEHAVSFEQFWTGETPLNGTDALPVVAGAGPHAGETLVVGDERAGVGGTVWARDALDGGPRWSPFGTSTWSVTWWWRELAVGGLVLLLGVLARRRRPRWLRRRPRGAPGGAARPRSGAGR